MNNLLLQPASGPKPRRNYDKTIRSPVRLSSIASHFTPEQFLFLKELYPSGAASIWGIAPARGFSIFPLLNRGDVVLFYAEQTFYASGIVTYKIHHRGLSDQLWGPKTPGEYFEYVYFLDEVTQRSIPLSAVSSHLQTKGPKWRVMGAELIGPPASDLICEELQIASETITSAPSDEEFRKAILRPSGNGELNRTVKGSARVEQSYLRYKLFGTRAVARCALCGNEFSVQNLIAAHIKKRTLCTNEEKLDAEHIVLPMCKFGCDSLYEAKIVIGTNGIVSEGRLAGLTARELAFARGLIGRSIIGYRSKMEPYFEHHRTH